jgi:hypothetical protein
MTGKHKYIQEKGTKRNKIKRRNIISLDTFPYTANVLKADMVHANVCIIFVYVWRTDAPGSRTVILNLNVECPVMVTQKIAFDL